MLASVADGDMAASDLCFTLLDTEERFGLTGWHAFERSPVPRSGGAGAAAPGGATEEQRRGRRARKQQESEERRRKAEAAARAAEQVRQARKKERAAADRPSAPAGPETPAPVLPSLGRRRALLTPSEEEEFDRDGPLGGRRGPGWVPFDAADEPDHPGLDGKVRPCVVIAGSDTHLLVRPGYSAGGVKSRDWKSHPVRHWRRSGFDEPTWIDVVAVRVPRPEDGADRIPRTGRLELALVTRWGQVRDVQVTA